MFHFILIHQHRYIVISFILTIMFSIFSCISSKKIVNEPARPAESYLPQDNKPPVSNITIPINITHYELKKMVNAQVPNPIYEDYSFDDEGGDGFMMNAYKSSDIEIEISGNAIKYKVPLKIWFKKELLVGSADGEGEIALSFKTDYNIREDWTIGTHTNIEYHEWIRKPVLKTGLGDLNIEWLANFVLNRFKSQLATKIDDMASKNLNLRPMLEEAWVSLQKPVLLSPEYGMWVKTTPLSISMTPLETISQSIRTLISVECINDVTFGQEPSFRANSNLPGLRVVNEVADEFQARISTEVPYTEAKRLALLKMKGQVFESAGKKVIVEDLDVYGDESQLVVKTLLSGAFKGNIYFKGRPVFNREKNQIEMQDFDYDLETKNYLHRTASWIFQGKIRKMMEENMAFPLDENINQLKTSVQETLQRYELRPGTILSGTLNDLRIDSTFLTPTSIKVNIAASGKLAVDIQNF